MNEKIIIIDSKYFIEVEEKQLILKETFVSVKKDGTNYNSEKVMGYFSNLESLLTKLHKLKIRDNITGTVTLDELKTILIQTQEYIHEISERIKI